MAETAKINGTERAYLEHGQGQPVVFVHGGVGDYREWETQVPAFAASFQTITLSCRGAWPNRKLEADEKITLDTFVEDLATFIKALDLEGGLRVFMTAVAGKEHVAAIPEQTFQAFVGNVGPFKVQLRAGFPPFGEDDARSIRVPTLLVSGADSPAPLTAVTDRLEEVLPDVSRLNIAGAGHNMLNTRPMEFNAGVTAFIDRP